MTTFTATAPIVKANDGRHGLRAPKGGCTVDGRRYAGGQFCPPYQLDNPYELPTVEIKGASYLVEPIEAGECGVSAVRLTKRVSREAYDVIRRHDDLVECSCPDFTFRHEGRGTTCKHGTAAMIRGLLPVAPAVAELAPEVPAENPRDAWPAWTDEATWTTEGPSGDDDGPSPSWDAERFEPEDVAAAYEAGYQLGLAGEYPRPPAHYSGREAHHFNCGRLAGFIGSPEGRAWRDDMRACRDRVEAEAGPRETDGYPAGYHS